MFHKCKYCDYQSPYRPNLRRHEKNKHGFQEPNSYQHASKAHPYEHPYLGNSNQQPNHYPQQTPEMVANNTYYAKETRAPTKISVGPNGPRAPTTISVPPQIGGVQEGSGIGDQFHRHSQNSFDAARHDANNRAPTTYREPGPVVRAPTTNSIPPVREGVQHGDGIDEPLDEDLQMDYKPTNEEDEDENIWDIITNIHGELEYIQNLKKTIW